MVFWLLSYLQFHGSKAIKVKQIESKEFWSICNFSNACYELICFHCFKASLIARWLFANSAHEGVQIGSLPFSFSLPLAMRRHMSVNHCSRRIFSQSSRVEGMAGAPWLLAMQVKCVVVSTIPFPPFYFDNMHLFSYPPFGVPCGCLWHSW